MTERISIITDEIAQDLDTVSRFLDEFDIRAIELRTLGGKRVPDVDIPLWDDLKKRCRDEGWRVIALSPGTFKGHCSDRSRSERELTDTLVRTIYQAQEIGAEYIITFGFMADKGEDAPEHVIDTMRRASLLCSEGGLPLLLENEPGSFAQTGESTRALIDMVNSPNLFANWDPCNSNVLGNPESLADGARALGGLIRHVHVKDGEIRPDSEFAKYGPISTGHLGWKEHLEVLKSIGYRGYFGVETHYEPLWEGSATVLRELREILAEIDFRGDGG